MNLRLPKDEEINIANGEDIARIMRKILLRQNRLHRKKEYFWAIGLNAGNDIEYIELVSIGAINIDNIEPVDVFSFAVSKKCTKIIICHNRPNGKIQPTKSVQKLTYKLLQGAKVLNILLLDHIIICEDKEYFSFGDSKSFPKEEDFE
ncbi:hypothetical protein EZY14_013455 [Kordia sp. TARA_039_SRF]|nr:hypothetical protein EZY14_013455 [Kordia sp. TARA_039_SRF]